MPIILFPILITAFTVNKFDAQELTQMVVTLPELNSQTLLKGLEADINNLSGIQFIDLSLISKTLVINYDTHKTSYVDILHALQKWGCSPDELSFHNLTSK